MGISEAYCGHVSEAQGHSGGVAFRESAWKDSSGGLVNRLGFVVDTAVTLAEEHRDRKKASRLRALSKRLWMKRHKEAEEFLMGEAPEDTEFRNWLKKKTPRAGKRWGVYGAYSLERFREALKRAA